MPIARRHPGRISLYRSVLSLTFTLSLLVTAPLASATSTAAQASACASVGQYGAYYTGVAALTRNDVWAVGTTGEHGVAGNWNGHSWTFMCLSGHRDIPVGVSAISPSDIWVVGVHEGHGGFIDHFNGTTWRRVPSPPGPRLNLQTVSAVDSSDAWAGGDRLEFWNGTRWRVIPSNLRAPFTAVKVVSANNVWVAGSLHKHRGPIGIEHWNGQTWTTTPITTARHDRIGAFSALSAKDIWATLGHRVAHWNGAQWKIMPDPKHATTSSFYSIDAITWHNVWIVGNGGNQGGYLSFINRISAAGRSRKSVPLGSLIEHWNGKSWRVVPTPQLGPVESYDVAPFLPVIGISAASPHAIWAAGIGAIEHWNGKTWHIAQPSAPKTYGGSLYGLAARSANNVWMVGEHFHSTWGNDRPSPLVERWHNGALVAVPSDPSIRRGELISVSTTGPNDAWTAGYQFTKSNKIARVVEEWDGSSWKVSPTAKDQNDSYLGAIAAVSKTDVWAVGAKLTEYSYGENGIIDHWNGTTWRLVHAPVLDEAGGESFLYAIYATSANDIWVAGEADSESSGGGLLEHWNGIKWSVAKSPPRFEAVFSLAGSGPNDIWATGDINRRNAIAHWNGKDWSLVAIPGGDAVSVSASSPRDAWAYVNVGYGFAQMIHWNGKLWKVVPSPDLGFERYASEVLSVSPKDAWAVGESDSPWLGATPIQHWNGKTWTSVVGPAPPK